MTTTTESNFNQTKEQALATMSNAKAKDVSVLSFYAEEVALSVYRNKLVGGYPVALCTVTKLDAEGKELSLPSVLVGSRW